MIERRYTGTKPKTILPKGAIDTQLHMYLPEFPAQPGGPALPDPLPGPAEYRQVMDWLGIDRLVVTQGNAHQHDNGNICALLDAMGVAWAAGKMASMAGAHTARERLARLPAPAAPRRAFVAN